MININIIVLNNFILYYTVKSGGDAVAPYFVPVMDILNVYLTPGIDQKLEPLQVLVIRKH